ncbi:MAG: TerB family tellurite resistance protein [Pseudomonadota bacterium]|nr:TerB family tellurite resistance protein [Pseudomonadota bacterium]
MIGRLKALFSLQELDVSPEQILDEKTVACAALLVEAAMVDGDFSDQERQIITLLVEERFLVDPALSGVLISTAEAKARRSVELYSVTKIISQTFSYEERMDILQSIWEVVLSDGRVDAFEDQLMRRLGGLIHISDRDRAFTRQRAEKVLAQD